MPNMLLLFNHTLTPLQEKGARENHRVKRIKVPPEEIQNLWSGIPAGLENIDDYLTPVRSWVEREGQQGDLLLIQGDFGACYLMVRYASEKGFIPVYSTTERVASEEHMPDGSVRVEHCFKHVIFRRYGG